MVIYLCLKRDDKMPEEIIKVIEQVDVCWPKDYILRFLYVKLAPCFRRDLSFFLAPYEERLKQYKSGVINNGTDIVCSTLVDYYIKIFRIFDIKAVKIIANSAELPLFAMIVYGERGLYYLDPLNDLMSNQYGLKTGFFATIPRYKTAQQAYPNLTSLSDDLLREMDEKLGLQQYGVYISDFIEMLREVLTFRSAACKRLNVNVEDTTALSERKLKIFNDELINIGKVSGQFERMQLYTYLWHRLFDKRERAQSDIVFNFDDPDQIKLNFLIFPQGEDAIIYEENRDAHGQYHIERIK